MESKIEEFTDLKAWQLGHKFVLLVYKETQAFPKCEVYGLSSQLRRAAVSYTSNVAEGFGRWGYKDKTRFYFIALSSLDEIKSQLLISRDLGYISNETYLEFEQMSTHLKKMTHGLIKSAKKKFNNKSKK